MTDTALSPQTDSQPRIMIEETSSHCKTMSSSGTFSDPGQENSVDTIVSDSALLRNRKSTQELLKEINQDQNINLDGPTDSYNNQNASGNYELESKSGHSISTSSPIRVQGLANDQEHDARRPNLGNTYSDSELLTVSKKEDPIFETTSTSQLKIPESNVSVTDSSSEELNASASIQDENKNYFENSTEGKNDFEEEVPSMPSSCEPPSSYHPPEAFKMTGMYDQISQMYPPSPTSPTQAAAAAAAAAAVAAYGGYQPAFYYPYYPPIPNLATPPPQFCYPASPTAMTIPSARSSPHLPLPHAQSYVMPPGAATPYQGANPIQYASPYLQAPRSIVPNPPLSGFRPPTFRPSNANFSRNANANGVGPQSNSALATFSSGKSPTQIPSSQLSLRNTIPMAQTFVDNSTEMQATKVEKGLVSDMTKSSGIQQPSQPSQRPLKSPMTRPAPPPAFTNLSRPLHSPTHGLPRPRHSEWAMWIGNLPNETTTEMLQDFFQGPEMESVFLISRSNCAFVNYRTKEALDSSLVRFQNAPFLGAHLVVRPRKMTSDPHNHVHSGHARFPSDTTSSSFSVRTSRGERRMSVGSSGATSFTHFSPYVRQGGPLEAFFILKSLTRDDLDISAQSGVWATQPHNEQRLNAAFRSYETVYLIFSANKSGEFYGLASMASEIPQREDTPSDHQVQWTAVATSSVSSVTTLNAQGGVGVFQEEFTSTETKTEISEYNDDVDEKGEEQVEKETENQNLVVNQEVEADEEEEEEEEEGEQTRTWGNPFRIHWLSLNKVPFTRTRHLKNPLNGYREVKISRDGTELDPAVGRRLVEEFFKPPPTPEVGMTCTMGSYMPMMATISSPMPRMTGLGLSSDVGIPPPQSTASYIGQRSMPIVTQYQVGNAPGGYKGYVPAPYTFEGFTAPIHTGMVYHLSSPPQHMVPRENGTRA